MPTPAAEPRPPTSPLTSAIALRVEEQRCGVLLSGSLTEVAYAPQFPSPRVERVSPGHVLALATTDDGRRIALWRWYDAVVVGAEDGSVRLWEPAHGEVLATPRDPEREYAPGTRAYASAGLPGADWWVAGPVTRTEPALVELDEVVRLYTEHDLWDSALA